MNHDAAFVLNPSAKFLTVINNIEERVCKIKGIINCVMLASEHISDASAKLPNSTVYHALWSIEGYVEELELLCRHLTELKNGD